MSTEFTITQLMMIKDQYHQIIEDQKQEILLLQSKNADYQRIIKQLESESKGLQYENEILQKTMAQKKVPDAQSIQSNQAISIRKLEEQLSKLQGIHQKEKEQWIKDQQEQIKRIVEMHQQTENTLNLEIDSLTRKNEQLNQLYQNLKNTQIFENEQFYIGQIEKQRKEIKKLKYSIDELKSQLQQQVTSKGEFEKKYNLLMDEKINNIYRKSTKSIQSRSQNQSRILPQNLDQTINNDVSRLSQNCSNNIRLSAINKALSDSIDDYDKSLLMSASHSKRKISKSELESKTPTDSIQNSLSSLKIVKRGTKPQIASQLSSPKQIDKRKQSVKCVKQYTFNLCEYNSPQAKGSVESLNESKSKINTNRSSIRNSKQKSTNNTKINNNQKHQRSQVKEKENQLTLTVPEENHNINVVYQHKEFQMLENKEERLNTNMRFNSLLKIL